VKIIIAGSRTITDPDVVLDALTSSPWSASISMLVHGGCRGVDLLAHDVCEGIVPAKVFAADWAKHGAAAGPIRNREMANFADALILIWDGKSRGSASMRAEMLRVGKPVFEKLVVERKVGT